MRYLTVTLFSLLLLASCGTANDGDTSNQEDPSEPESEVQAPDGPVEVHKSELEREMSPSVDAQTMEQLARDNRDFALP